MPVPAQWITNTEDPTCKGCGSKEFNDIGECETCGKMLLFYGNKKVADEKKAKRTRRLITAVEKWSKTRVPKNHQDRCMICGSRPNKIEEVYNSETISIMVAMFLKEQSEYKKAKEIAQKIYTDIDNREKEVQLITKALLRNQNMVLPAKNINELQAEAEKYIKGSEFSICLECLRKEDVAEEKRREKAENANEKETAMTSAMKKVANQESDEMGPKFRPNLNHQKDWGEETIDHEEWEDDPVEQETDWDGDDWDDDWEETTPAESAPMAPIPEISQEELDGFGDPFEDNWEEDIARLRAQQGS